MGFNVRTKERTMGKFKDLMDTFRNEANRVKRSKKKCARDSWRDACTPKQSVWLFFGKPIILFFEKCLVSSSRIDLRCCEYMFINSHFVLYFIDLTRYVNSSSRGIFVTLHRFSSIIVNGFISFQTKQISG